MKIKINKKRRNFLKLLFFGGGAFILGGLLGKLGWEVKESKLNNFIIRESNKELVFYNRKGHKLFSVSDNGDLEIS